MVRDELIELVSRISNPDSWRQAERRWRGQIAPTIQRDGYKRIPLPGYVGDAYRSTRIVFLGTNPGPGKGINNRRQEDEELFRSLLPEFVNASDVQNFEKVNDYLAREMIKRTESCQGRGCPNLPGCG